jgi:hypothetical protein
MATRSTIALEFADGTVQQVYCHWDGYLEHNGKILAEHYSDPFKLRDLIDLGDLSSLDERVGTQHSFEKAPEGECTFYARDRNESGCGAKKFKDYADYVENHQYEEFEYILRTDGQWYVKSYDRPYVLLVTALEAIQAQEEAADA